MRILIALLLLIGTLTAAHAVPCFDSIEAARAAHVEGRLAYQLIHGPKEWFKGHKGQHVQCDPTERKVMQAAARSSIGHTTPSEKRPARATRAAPVAAMTSLSWEIPAAQETALSASTAEQSGRAYASLESRWGMPPRSKDDSKHDVSLPVRPVALAALTVNARPQKNVSPFSLLWLIVSCAFIGGGLWLLPKAFKVPT